MARSRKQTAATVETQEVGDPMFHIHCDLPNASERISGIAFVKKGEGGVRTAEPVTADVVALFDGIPGYSFEPAGSVPPDGSGDPAPGVPDVTPEVEPEATPEVEPVTEQNPVVEPEKTDLF